MVSKLEDTNRGKLQISKPGQRSGLLACSGRYLPRPAAIAQLQTIGQQLGFDVFSLVLTKELLKLLAAVAQARMQGNDVVLIGTAGRLHVDETLMEELRQIGSG